MEAFICAPAHSSGFFQLEFNENQSGHARLLCSMKPHICICCGEPMAKAAKSRSANPNLCASCSGLADGAEAPGDIKGPPPQPDSNQSPGAVAEAPTRLA